MDNLYNIGIFFAGLGLFLASLGLFWFVSLYDKKNKK